MSPVPSPRRSRRKARPRWGTRMATAMSVLVLGAGGVGHAVVSRLDDIGRVDPFHDMKNRPAGGRGMNVLLVGTDGRDEITPAEKAKYHLGGAPCHCTDTIMIVHVSADRSRVSVVSLPRDSYAVVPARTDPATGKERAAHPIKLNAAYAEGGPGLTVRTVEQMTHVKIDHYLEVDFTSFMKTVDVLGGVDVCTAHPLQDAYTGLDLPVGTTRLDGGEALQYVRSRHLDAASDLARMQRQQRFLASLIARATSSGVLLNPVKFREVASTIFDSVRADKSFGTDEMLALGQAMRGFTPASSEFSSVPVGDPSFPVKGLGSTVKWDTSKAAALFGALREDRPIAAPLPEQRQATRVDVPPDQILVQVTNGTAKNGLATRAVQELHDTGFLASVAPTAPAAPAVPVPTTTTAAAAAATSPATEQPNPHTVIEYDPRWDRSVKSVAAALPGAELRAVNGIGGTIKVTIGSDFDSVTRVRADEPAADKFDAVKGDEVVCH
ncbi:LCP family protein [Streptomyces sp. NPDC051320]|uniref:LCP family protein n=1 Tax=Streptomyces sp. NPDC051320 TaxID=3154644 RepID=UPI00342CEA5B